MLTDHFQTLILHGDEAWRDELSATLTRRGVQCVSAGNLRDFAVAHTSCDVSSVVLRVPHCDGETVTRMISELREHLPNSAIIVLIPSGNTVVTRAAFRAGAWDCLEESAEASQIVACVADATRKRPTSVETRVGANTASAPEPSKEVSQATPKRSASAMVKATRQPDMATQACPMPPARVKTMSPAAAGTHSALPDNKAFLDVLGGLRSLCRRHGQPLSIMMFDLHRFPECNERHLPALKESIRNWLASILRRVCRRSDVVARYDGDRLIVALPDSRTTDATELANRCRRAMCAHPLTVAGQTSELTVSVGVAGSTVEFIETERQLVERSRIALDQANKQGHDQTVTWSELLENHPSRRDLQKFTIEDASRWVERIHRHLRSTYVESTQALVAAVEAKDPFTRAHSLTVAGYAETIARRMRLPVRMVENLRAAALLHDVGKIGVPDAILTKPGPLTNEEFNVIKRHPETALEILSHVSFLTDERPLILHHHERYDGKGYPTGLVGRFIPIGARILAVADALDTMFSARTYKQPYSIGQVRAELQAGAGRQFDPAVIDVALKWLTEAPDDFPVR